jgi:serine/threonine protein kinase
MTTMRQIASRHQRPAAALPAGTALRGRFVVVRQIARTDLSIVYLGYDRLTGREVAIKQARSLADAEARRLFVREARLLRDLDHRQLARLYAVFRERSSIYLVMEYIRGVVMPPKNWVVSLDCLDEQGGI